MGIEGVVLEHHGDVAGFGRRVVHHRPADRDLAVGDVLEAGDHPKQGGLAAAGRADENQELAVVDVNRHAMNDRDIVEGFVDVLNRDGGHGYPLSAQSDP